MSNYFFATLKDGMAHFDEHEVRHLKVMRFSKGSEIKFTDGNGKMFLGKLINDDTASVVKLIKDQKKSFPKIHVVFSPVRWERTRFLIEKAVELRVCSLVFMNAKRTTRLETESKLRKAILIARDAMKQCGALYMPNILRFSDFVFPPNSTRWMLDVKGKWTLSELTEVRKDVVVAVGPEGGFTEEEKNLFKSNHFMSVKMGNRTLRSETAVLTVMVAINILSKKF